FDQVIIVSDNNKQSSLSVCLRITGGTLQDNQRVIDAVRAAPGGVRSIFSSTGTEP
ncbi:histidinol-phosphate transaminase, partial [Salmonella enterica subsp. enterica serovar Kentucky]